MPFAIQNRKTGKFAVSPAGRPKWGYTRFDGEFDRKVYELVDVEDMPAETDMELPEKTVPEKLEAIFRAQPVEVRAQFYAFKAAVKAALDTGDHEAAAVIVNGVEVPDALKDVKAEMLGVFNSGKH